MCQQAQVYCTPGRAKKVTAAILFVCFTASTIVHTVRFIVRHGTTLYNLVFSIFYVLFYVIVPVSVLVVNVIVVREVRQASNKAAVNLGVKQHQQPTSSNSIVPTAMLVTTSLIYVLLRGTVIVVLLVLWWVPRAAFSQVTWVMLNKVWAVAYAAYSFVFCYNFFVYLITGKQFLCQLHKLICRRSAAAEAAADDASVPTRCTNLADTAV